jgi:hypothetical protein
MNAVVKNTGVLLPKNTAAGENYGTLAKLIAVDGDQWYRVRCGKESSLWIRTTFSELENKMWFEYIDEQWQLHKNIYDLHEKLYTMLVLRWS